jgi:hypothetical protein
MFSLLTAKSQSLLNLLVLKESIITTVLRTFDVMISPTTIPYRIHMIGHIKTYNKDSLVTLYGSTVAIFV